MPNTTTNPYRDVLEELAKSRGLSGAEELAKKAAEADPDYTAEEILAADPGGFGPALDKALGGTTEEERARLVRGVMGLHRWEAKSR